jgi:hypothetical protein
LRRFSHKRQRLAVAFHPNQRNAVKRKLLVVNIPAASGCQPSFQRVLDKNKSIIATSSHK